jgi:hypothetical protein
MLQTLSSKDFGVTDKPTPKPKELAVIQGRIQKVEPVVIKTDAKGETKIIRPQVSVGGKVQSAPPTSMAEKEGQKASSSESGKSGNDAKSANKISLDKTKEGQKPENNIDNKLLGMINQFIRGSADEKEKNPKNKPSEATKAQPLSVPEIMKLLQKFKEKNTNKDNENSGKEKQATEQQPANVSKAEQSESTKGNATDTQQVDAKSKALQAAMELFKVIGPASFEPKGNTSSVMEQLAAAAEEASVALKLLNKTGSVDKLKGTKVPSGEGDVMYNVKLLQEELNKSMKNKSNIEMTPSPVPLTNATANTSKMAVVNVSSSNPQLSEFILRLQDTINPQGKDSSSSSLVNERGGVAVRKEEGKPTLSEVQI